MRPNTFEDLPDELRPLYARKRGMQTVGQWMVLIGALSVCCGAIGTAFLSVGLLSFAVTLEFIMTTSVVGGVLLFQGSIAIVVTNAM